MTPEQYIMGCRFKFNEKVIDIHEFGKALRAISHYSINREFLMNSGKR